MMKANLRSFSLAAIAVCGMLCSTVQPAGAFELLNRLGLSNVAAQKGASQKGASQKGAHQKGAHQKGAHQKGAHQKGASQKGAHQKSPRQKLWSPKGKGGIKKAPRQKLWSPKGAAQKGGKGKGKGGTVLSTPAVVVPGELEGPADARAPTPPPIEAATRAWLLR